MNDKEVIKRLAEKGKRGGLRLAVHQIKIARHIAKNGPVTMGDLLAAEAVSGDYAESMIHKMEDDND